MASMLAERAEQVEAVSGDVQKKNTKSRKKTHEDEWMSGEWKARRKAKKKQKKGIQYPTPHRILISPMMTCGEARETRSQPHPLATLILSPCSSFRTVL
jgi:hypothetical protein